MKKVLLLFLFVSCILACSKEETVFSLNERSSSTTISIESALKSLDSVANSLYGPKTKSGFHHYSKDKVQVLHGESIALRTKSCVDDIPDDLLYVVNFDDDGYAVVAATTKLSDRVLCITEQGELSVDELVSSIDDLLVGTKVAVNEADTTDVEFVPVGIDVIPQILMSSVILETQFDVHPDDGTSTKSAPSGTKYGPYLRTKWGQTTGYYPVYPYYVRLFNRYTPNHAAAGCVAIAAAQIVEWNSYDEGLFGAWGIDGCSCNWRYMDTVYNFQIANQVYLNDTTYYDQVAHFVHGVGVECNISYGSSEGAPSSGFAINVKSTFESFGYSNVKRRIGFGSTNQNYATECIRSRKPVYLDGYKTGAGGHAWVLDGECGSYYHINWGWEGTSDGYYAKGVFKTTSRYGRDDEYDLVTSTMDKEYTWDYRLITYDL